MLSRRINLSDCPLFEGVSDSQLAALSAGAARRLYAAGRQIFREGDRGDSLIIVESGEVRLSVSSPTQRPIVVAILGPGDSFGELSLLDGDPRCATATAVTDTTTLEVPREVFIACLRADGELSLAVLQSLARVIRRTNAQLGDVAMLDAFGRLAKELLRLADLHGVQVAEGTLIDLQLTDTDLAALAGLFPIEVARALMIYEYNDTLRRRDDRIILRGLDALKRAAQRPRIQYPVAAN